MDVLWKSFRFVSMCHFNKILFLLRIFQIRQNISINGEKLLRILQTDTPFTFIIKNVFLVPCRRATLYIKSARLVSFL